MYLIRVGFLFQIVILHITHTHNLKAIGIEHHCDMAFSPMMKRAEPWVQTGDDSVIIIEAEPSAYCTTLENLASKTDAWLNTSIASCHAHAYRHFIQNIRQASNRLPDISTMSLTHACRGAYVIRFETLQGANEACSKAYDAKARDSLFIPAHAYWKSALDISLDERMTKLFTRLDDWDPRDYFALIIGILGAARDTTYYCMVILHRECSMSATNIASTSTSTSTVLVKQDTTRPSSRENKNKDQVLSEAPSSKPAAIVFSTCPMCPESKLKCTVKCLLCSDVQYCSVEHCKMHTSHALWCSRKQGGR